MISETLAKRVPEIAGEGGSGQHGCGNQAGEQDGGFHDELLRFRLNSAGNVAAENKDLAAVRFKNLFNGGSADSSRLADNPYSYFSDFTAVQFETMTPTHWSTAMTRITWTA